MLKVNKKVFSLALFTISIFIAINSISMLEHLLSTRDTVLQVQYCIRTLPYGAYWYMTICLLSLPQKGHLFLMQFLKLEGKGVILGCKLSSTLCLFLTTQWALGEEGATREHLPRENDFPIHDTGWHFQKKKKKRSHKVIVVSLVGWAGGR